MNKELLFENEKWEKLIDFTEIKDGGIEIKEILFRLNKETETEK